MTAPDKMKRALNEVEALVLTYADNMEYDAFRHLLSERAELLATVERMRAALKPFAKAATLFDMGDYINRDASIYEPVAGEEYYLNSGHLLAARAALTTGEATTPNAGERG